MHAHFLAILIFKTFCVLSESRKAFQMGRRYLQDPSQFSIKTIVNLIEKGSILTDSNDINECFNCYFTNITDRLDTSCHIIEDKPALGAIERYKAPPRFIKIKQLINASHQFIFCKFGTKEVWGEMNRLEL